jgi:nucleoid-associated protein YgaU
MTTGTKIFLAVFALIVGILVVYYGLVVPERTSTTPGTETGPDVAINDPTDQSGADNSAPQNGQAISAREGESGTPTFRGAPPPRQPGPTSPVVNLQPPANASPAGGLLSEGLREASEGTDSPGYVQPLGDAPTTLPNPFLPLIGLNAGDLPAAGETPPGDALPQTLPQDVTPPASATQPALPPSTPNRSGASSAQAPSRGSPGAGRAPPRIEYIISEGDTYSSIAQEWFGDKAKWSLIAKENPTVDPMRLKIGQRIYLPAKDAATAPAAAAAAAEPAPNEGELIYTVQSGDTLSSIARDHYGDPAQWQEIYDRNRETIGSDPGTLKVGMKLRLMMKRA